MSIYRKPNRADEADLDPDLLSQEHGTLTNVKQAQTRYIARSRVITHKIASRSLRLLP